jgi:hypothetical protein
MKGTKIGALWIRQSKVNHLPSISTLFVLRTLTQHEWVIHILNFEMSLSIHMALKLNDLNNDGFVITIEHYLML